MWYEVKQDSPELEKIMGMDATFGCGRYNPIPKEMYNSLIAKGNTRLFYYEDDKWKFYLLCIKHDLDEFFVAHRASLQWDFADNSIKPFQFLPILANKTKELLQEYGLPMKYLRFTEAMADEKGSAARTYKNELKGKWQEEHGNKANAQIFVIQYYNSLGMNIEFYDDYDWVSLI